MSRSETGGLPIRTTARSDWEKFVPELFNRVIVGCRFGIGVVSVDKGLFSRSLKFMINQDFPESGIDAYVRKNLTLDHVDMFFQGGGGTSIDSQNRLVKITGPGMGLPMNSLIAPIENRANRKLRTIVIFGGSRLEGQLEARIASLDEFLGRDGAPAASGPAGKTGGLPSFGELTEQIKKINTRRLFDYDLSELARLANQMEEHRNALPPTLKPVYMKISKYVLEKRLKKR